MSLSMFADEEIAENAFKQETKSFHENLSKSRSSTRTAGVKMENFTKASASCFTKQGGDNSALPSPAFEYNPMQQQKTPSTLNEQSESKGYLYDPIAKFGEYIAQNWIGGVSQPKNEEPKLRVNMDQDAGFLDITNFSELQDDTGQFTNQQDISVNVETPCQSNNFFHDHQTGMLNRALTMNMPRISHVSKESLLSEDCPSESPVQERDALEQGQPSQTLSIRKMQDEL